MAMVSHGPGSHALAPSETAAAEVQQRVQQELASRVQRGDISTALQVLSAYPDQVSVAVDAVGSSPLHLAARGGHLAMARELIAKGGEANLRDSNRRTPLHVACEEGHADLALELLMAGAEADAVDAIHETALHKASMLGSRSLEIFQVLLEHGGANPALGNGSQTTPLMLLAGFGQTDTVEYVLQRDDRTSLAAAANENGWTALHLAANGRNQPKRYATCCRLLVEAKADVDCLDEDRKTPLHRAAATGNLETIRELVRRGANPDERDNCRWTPLHYAVQDGNLAVAKLLMDAKAEVQTPSSPCLQPLALAAMENQVKVAELLMAHKADPNLRSKGVASAIMIARKDPEKYSEILGLFELGWISH